jgi:adenosylcobinamide-GDP ribazoletransferase
VSKAAQPAGGARRELILALAAVQYFTRIPVPRFVGHSQAQLNDAARYFPLVGLIVGGVIAALLFGAAQLWPYSVAVILAIAAGVLLTGAFHEDGLADAVDGLGGGFERDRRLAIMRDSRIGSYGSIALLLSFSLRFACLLAFPLAEAMALLIAAHVISRCGPVLLMRTLPYVREDDSRAKPLVTTLSRTSLIVALSTERPTSAASGLPQLALGVVLAAGVLWYWRRLIRNLIGGYTGDCLGAAQQLAELSLYLGTLAAWSI